MADTALKRPFAIYMPNNGMDGQKSYLDGEKRSIVTDLFCGMTLSRNPDVWQSLPAQNRCDQEASPDFIALSQHFENLKRKPGSTRQDRRKA